MPLLATVASLDDVEEALKPFYAQQGDVFALQIEGVDSHPDVSNLKSAYDRVKQDRDTIRGERDDAKARLSSLPEDFDPAVWKKAKEGKSDPSDLIQVRQSLEGERDEWKSKYEDLVANTRQKSIREAVQSALAESGVPEGRRRGAALDMMDGHKVEMQGDKPVIETDMGPMDVAEYAKRWVSKSGQEYVAPPKGGGAGGSNEPSGKKFSELTEQERLQLAKTAPEKFRRLQSENAPPQ